MQSTVSVRGPQPSPANERLEFFKAEKPVREVVYGLDEFLAQAKGRMHYEILREPFDAGGLVGYRVRFSLSARSKEGHIVKYEEEKVLDPFQIDDPKYANTVDALREAYAKAVEEFAGRAKALGATPGRWC